jgi:hypothetical protein
MYVPLEVFRLSCRLQRDRNRLDASEKTITTVKPFQPFFGLTGMACLPIPRPAYGDIPISMYGIASLLYNAIESPKVLSRGKSIYI